MKLALVIIEIAALLVCIIFGYLWIQKPDGPYEPLFTVSGLVFVVTELYRRYKGKIFRKEGKELTAAETIQHREKLRPQFEKEIYKCRAKELRKDVIIRHVSQADSYPDIDEKAKGISPWFRASLLATYHRGIMVGLRFGTLTICTNGYRYTNYNAGEEGDIKVHLIGKISYDSIETVNFNGDEHYYFPHIYCYYDHDGEPYEQLIYCEEKDMGSGHLYYKEIAKYKDVKNNSIGTGAEYFA